MKLELLDNDPFNAPTPGQSLTDTPGKWQWEQPAQINDPVEAFEKVLSSLQDPLTTETVNKLMYVGVSIETILSGIMVKMFGEGVFTPDVAEMIKPLLARYLIRQANENGIKANIVNKFPKPPLGDGDTLDLLKKLRPKEYSNLMEKINNKQEIKEPQGFMVKDEEQ